MIATKELLSVLASYCQIPDAVFVLRRSGKRRGTNTNCILEIPPTPMNARFLSQINTPYLLLLLRSTINVKIIGVITRMKVFLPVYIQKDGFVNGLEAKRYPRGYLFIFCKGFICPLKKGLCV
jgi:hypothetical protein